MKYLYHYMLLINKQLQSTRFIVTSTAIVNLSAVATLVLYNNFDKKTATYLMTNNTSLFQERYNEFVFNTSIFIDLPVGFYRYKIVDGDDVKSFGVLKVVDNTNSVDDVIDTMYLTVTPTETDDDIITYI